jgi:hypothetical protein
LPPSDPTQKRLRPGEKDSDDESDEESEYKGEGDDEGEEEEDEEDSARDTAWEIVAILDERLYWSAGDYQRQYRLQRRGRGTAAAYTVADQHDDEDMPIRVLNAWRSSHPIIDVRWVFQKKSGSRGKPSAAALEKHKQHWSECCKNKC